MNTSKAAQSVNSRFSNVITGWDEKHPGRIYFDLPAAKLREFVSYVFNDLSLRFIIASGTDTRRSIEILYHFADDSTGTILSARVTITNKKDPVIDSIADFFIGSAWIEREIHELLGVKFEGNENLKHLLLHDDWPKNDYPLRHDNE